MQGEHRTDRFPTTWWPRIVAAGGRASPDARRALEELCAIYWFPLYAFIRRKGFGAEEAADLTQGYFVRLLEWSTVGAADRERGRFRTFLLTDCTRFLTDQIRCEHAAKRGGGALPFSIDARDAEGRYVREPSHDQTPERRFERDWALALLDTVLGRLRSDYERSGRGETFEALKCFLTEGARALPGAEAAARLGITTKALHVATHRLRRRYRDLIREAIAETVADPAEVDEELNDLFVALGS